jgi:hypothetical protein
MKFKCDTCGKEIIDTGMVCGCPVLAMSCECGGALLREDTDPGESLMVRRRRWNQMKL